MNKNDNLNIVKHVGDMLQFEYGNEFGFFANQINRIKLVEFCEYFNSDSWTQTNGYFIDAKFSKDDSHVMLFKTDGSLRVLVRLLDHTVYIEATEFDWLKISKPLFINLQKLWKNFLAKNISEYREHMRKTAILAPAGPIYSF